MIAADLARSTFRHGGVSLSYVEAGAGDPVLLIHGFASSAAINWVDTGWFATLNKAGFRTVALDNRGHGFSDRFTDPAAYLPEAMAGDAAALLDHLGIGRADVIGYSMGARIATALGLGWPDRVRSLTLGGIGANILHGSEHAERIARALEAPRIEDVTDRAGMRFRRFAEQTKSDFAALAACMRGQAVGFQPAALAHLDMPVLVAMGTEDDIAISADPLLRIIPHAEFLPIPRRDHMKAVGDPVFKRGVLDFLARRP